MKPKKVKCPVCESILEYGNEDVEKGKDTMHRVYH